MRGRDTRTPLVAAVAATVLLSIAPPPIARAEHDRFDHYHWWRTSNPITLHLAADATPDSHANVLQAASDWSKSSVLDVVVGPASGEAGCPFVTGRINVCNAPYGETGWAGQVAYVADSSGHITAATARVNDTYTVARVPLYRQMLFCHEIGHALGLGHEAVHDDSCMENDGDTVTSATPGPHDYEMLETIYEHSDTTRTKAPKRRAPGRHRDGGDTMEVVELADGGTFVTITTPA